MIVSEEGGSYPRFSGAGIWGSGLGLGSWRKCRGEKGVGRWDVGRDMGRGGIG